MPDDSERTESFPRDTTLGRGWEDLGVGAPTLIALGKLCSQALSEPPVETLLSRPAKALLHVARRRGVFEVRAFNHAFHAPERWLTVWIETAPDEWHAFRAPDDPKRMIGFLDAFAELCRAGLIVHHLYREFSLNSRGFSAAEAVEEQEVAAELDALRPR